MDADLDHVVQLAAGTQGVHHDRQTFEIAGQDFHLGLDVDEDQPTDVHNLHREGNVAEEHHVDVRGLPACAGLVGPDDDRLVRPDREGRALFVVGFETDHQGTQVLLGGLCTVIRALHGANGESVAHEGLTLCRHDLELALVVGDDGLDLDDLFSSVIIEIARPEIAHTSFLDAVGGGAGGHEDEGEKDGGTHWELQF